MDFTATVDAYKALIDPLTRQVAVLEQHKIQCERDLAAEKKKLKRLERKLWRINENLRKNKERIEELEKKYGE